MRKTYQCSHLDSPNRNQIQEQKHVVSIRSENLAINTKSYPYVVHDDRIIVSNLLVGEARGLRIIPANPILYISFSIVIHVNEQVRTPYIHYCHEHIDCRRKKDSHLLPKQHCQFLRDALHREWKALPDP